MNRIACDCGCDGTVSDLVLLALESRFRYGGVPHEAASDIYDLEDAQARFGHTPHRRPAQPADYRMAA